MSTKVHSITRAKVLSQFLHPLTHRVAVAKIPRLQAFEADTYLGLRLIIPQRLEPFGQWLFAFFGLVSEHFNHGNNVAYKLQDGKSIE